MDTDYINYKSKGLMSITKDNTGAFILTQKSFNSETGQPSIDKIAKINVTDLKNRIATSQATIANLQAILNDVNALQPPKAV